MKSPASIPKPPNSYSFGKLACKSLHHALAFIPNYDILSVDARVAELADALDSGSSE